MTAMFTGAVHVAWATPVLALFACDSDILPALSALLVKCFQKPQRRTSQLRPPQTPGPGSKQHLPWTKHHVVLASPGTVAQVLSTSRFVAHGWPHCMSRGENPVSPALLKETPNNVI